MSVALTAEDLAKMKVPELKKELKSRDLPVSGNKGDLLERLIEALKAEEAEALLEDGSADDDVSLDKLDEPLVQESVDTAKVSIPAKTAAVVAAPVTKSVSVAPTTAPTATAAKKPVLHKTDDAAVNSKPEATDSAPVKPGEQLTADQKKMSRAERFGIVSDDVAKSKRAERFGIVSDADKKAQRAAKFGLTTDSVPTEQDDEKKSKRAERFGIVSSQSDPKNGESTEMTEEARQKLLKRKQRFGEVTSDPVNKVQTDEKLKQRAARFGAISGPALTADEEARKKKRMERFAAA